MKLEVARLKKCYAAIEARLSGPEGERETLLASGFSAADIAVGQAVYMAQHFAALDGFPAVAEWFGRISARPAFKASLPGTEGGRLYDRDFYPAWEMPQ